MKKTITFFTLTLLSLLPFAPYWVQSKPEFVEGIVAAVNGEPILHSEFVTSWSRFQTQNPDARLSDMQMLKKRLLNHLILEKLQIQSAAKKGIRINERELNSHIMNIATQNRLSLKGLFEEVAKTGQTPQTFRKEIRTQVIIQRLQQQLFGSQIQVSEQEIDEILDQENQINDPNEYKMDRILIATKNNQQQSWQAALKRTQQIKQRLDSKKQKLKHFKTQKNLYSGLNDALSNAQLKWQDSSNLPDIFLKQLQRLKKEEISEPIKTGRGYFLLILVDKQPKKRIIAYKYKLQQLFLSALSYQPATASELANVIIQAVQESNQPETTFAEYVSQYSQDQYANRKGKTDWITEDLLSQELVSDIKKAQKNQIRLVQEPQGWLLYRFLEKKTFNASNKLKRNQIRQRLLLSEVEKLYQNYLRQLRISSAIYIHPNYQ